MYNVTQAFIDAIKQNGRQFKSSVTIRDTTFDDNSIIEIGLEENVNPTESFMLGGVGSSKLDVTLINVPDTLILEDANVTSTISLLVNGVYEDVPLGVFTVDDVGKDKNVVKLSCYDNMIKLEKVYFSDLSYPTDINSVANEICAKAGVDLATVLPNIQIDKIDGYTCREAIGFIASFLGGFARFNRQGKLEILSYVDSGFSVISDNYFPGFKTAESLFTIGKITCKVGDSILTTGTNGNEIQFENPIITQDQLNSIYNTLKNLSYMPYNMDWQGNQALQAGDKITITDLKGNTYNTLLMDNKITYKGGLSGTASAVGKTETGQNFSSSGTMKSSIDRMVIEQANIKLLLADKVNTDYLIANYATINNLNATTARVSTLETTTAHITNGIIDNATIDVANVNNISAIYATITSLNATNARIDNIVVSTAQIADLAVTNAKIANAAIDNAKIANAAIGTAQIQLGAITTALIATAAIGTTQIEDGSITDAKIMGLTASKITAGTIDATNIDVINLNCANLTVGTINGTQISAGAIDPTKLTTALNNTINNASSAANTALSTANGKNTVTYSTTQPPTTGNTVDDIWFDTDDGYKMYRWDGSAWVASQFGTNAIANLAITNAQIANATILDAKISSVDAGKITTGYLAAARIAANTITSAMIAANTITASNIAAGAITADRLSVQSYGVNKILNADGSLNSANATAGMNFTNWTVGAVSTTGYIIRELKPFIDGGNVPVFHFYDTNASGTISTNLYSTTIKVDPNKTYYLEGWVYQASGGGQFYLGIEQLDSAGLDLDGNGPYITSGSPTVGQWIYYSGYIYPARTKAKLTAQYVAGADITVTVDSTAGFANSGSANIGDKSFNYTGKTTTQFTGVTAGTVTGTIAIGTVVGQRTPITQSAATSGTDYEFQSQYVDKIQVKVFAAYGYSGTADVYVYGLSIREVGGTLIDGSGLVSSSITGDKIAAATITANNIVASTITGDKIAANTITANNVVAGTITATQIAAGTITASLIAAGAITGDMISGGTITGVILNAKDTLNVASNVWNNGTSYGITFGGTVSGYVGPSTLKYYQDMTGNGGTYLSFGMASGAQFIVDNAMGIDLRAPGSTITITGSQIKLNGLLNAPPTVGYTSAAISGSINLPDSYLPNGGFATALHMASTHSSGYRQHVSIGNYRTGTGWGGGFFVALGGNDNYPTNFWLLDYNGNISYSSGGNITFSNDIVTYGTAYVSRLAGSVTSNDYFNIGTGSCKIDCSGGTARFQSSASNYISIDGNSFSVYIGGTTRFAVSSTGSKTGGTMDIDGITYGMAPVDCPQQVIENFIWHVQVDAAGTFVTLDPIYKRMIADYDVWPSKPINIESMTADGFTVTGYTGTVTFRVVGKRKDSLDYYYPIMNNKVA